MSRWTRAFLAGVAATSVALSGLPHATATLDALAAGSTFCDGQGTIALGEGSPSQVDVNADVLRPAFAAACPNAAQPEFQGSGDVNAVTKLFDRSRDFGGSDVPLSLMQKVQLENDLVYAQGRTSPIHQIPVYVDVLAVGYNLSCLPAGTPLRLRSEVLSLIFAGEIKRWNHALLTQDNPALASCNQAIGLVKRTGVAGSTATFKDYLAKRTPLWAYYRQPEHNAEWPADATFVGASSTDAGIAAILTTTAGTIGYLQYHAARINGVRVASLDNPVSRLQVQPADRFVAPTPAGCQTAAQTAITLPVVDPATLPNGQVVAVPAPTRGDWGTVSLTDAPLGYPICNFGFWFVFGNWGPAYGFLNSLGHIRTIVDYLWVATAPSTQQSLLARDFAPLPESVRLASRRGLDSIRMLAGLLD